MLAVACGIVSCLAMQCSIVNAAGRDCRALRSSTRLHYQAAEQVGCTSALFGCTSALSVLVSAEVQSTEPTSNAPLARQDVIPHHGQPGSVVLWGVTQLKAGKVFCSKYW